MAEARRRPVITFGMVAWVFVLVAIAVVQFARGAYIDGIVFGLVAAALIADGIGMLQRQSSRTRAVPLALLLVIAALCAVILLLAPRHGVVATVVFVAIGVAVVLVGWRQPGGEQKGWTPTRVRAATAWSIAGVIGCLWELTMYILGSLHVGGRESFPALSDLLDPLIDTVPGKAVFIVLWLLLGLFLLRRTGRR